jgi:hypothetical protein
VLRVYFDLFEIPLENINQQTTYMSQAHPLFRRILICCLIEWSKVACLADPVANFTGSGLKWR